MNGGLITDLILIIRTNNFRATRALVTATIISLSPCPNPQKIKINNGHICYVLPYIIGIGANGLLWIRSIPAGLNILFFASKKIHKHSFYGRITTGRQVEIKLARDVQ